MIDFLKEQIQEISKTSEVEVMDIGADKDHFHMPFKAKPTLDMPRYVKAIKTITSREIQRKSFQVKEEFWRGHPWSPSPSDERTGNTGGAEKICGEPGKRVT
ncbi:hypothetical protein GCM10007108_14690 [Thermogymnomonas acidicola]|uniref:Transposase IS200-like domain-containing protein n=1 Tax=Thermogymnomonas acidicola TaxID=399579 RepID=A0AA37F9U6_9ARCH|nr:IS200/IS605 family transposase [Thermogymnomonas acidicola]GGM77618.1 hypothetical protein GCM10007108_14690 [Thermogymnomonas acidicola]